MKLNEISQRIMYHITSIDALPQIKQQGLQPRDAEGVWAHIGYKGRVYLTAQDDEETVFELMAMLSNKFRAYNMEEWTEEDFAAYENNYVMLTVDVSGYDIQPDQSAPDWWHSFFVTQTIPPERILSSRPVKLEVPS